ncbi:unnamed protein product [Enterobius vermicularis]|uniref:Sperm surface protein Sp17 n=1 Tax=Enterobius vermicularis TaxID=51028 RepID=A0A0N4VHY0_ENTVE|nr:unnamed protein product [Enterobius vermicularis]
MIINKEKQLRCGHLCRSPPRHTMEIAATKIQAAFRGHIAREKYGTVPSHHQNRRNSMEHLSSKMCDDVAKRRASNQEFGSIDPEEERAATKIQAEFRGYITRKHLEEMKKDVATSNGNTVH